MRILGIDFGSKRVGVAISDEQRKFALPVSVIENSSVLEDEIEKIAVQNGTKEIVMGESLNFKGEANTVLSSSFKFKEKMEKRGFKVYLEKEFLSSFEAERFQGKTTMTDASAAAIISQRYLDRDLNTVNNVNDAKNSSCKVNSDIILKNKNMITYDEFKKVEIRAGKILSAEKIPETDKLLKLSVDFGEKDESGNPKPRQIVSGIAIKFPDTAALVGKTCMFVTNLEPRMIKGFESNGMLFALSTPEGGFSLLLPNETIPPGTMAS